MLVGDLQVVPDLPPRHLAPMGAQPLVPWTVLRLVVAGWAWLTTQTERVPEALR